MLARTDKYNSAEKALRRTVLGRNPDKLAKAVELALKHCEKARAYSWSEAELREQSRDSASKWDGANAAALKLANHLEQLDRMTALARIGAASRKPGAIVAKAFREGEEIADADVKVFINLPNLLRALAKQDPRRGGRGGYVFGPLRIGRPSRKRPSRETVLAVVLAHIFGRVSKHNGDGVPYIAPGENITTGIAWEAAADFASEALGGTVNVATAKKFMHDHRDHLSFRAWPRA